MILSGFSGVTRTQSNDNQEVQKLEKRSKKKKSKFTSQGVILTIKRGKQINNEYTLKNICKQIQDPG